MIYETQHRKLKMEQYAPHTKKVVKCEFHQLVLVIW